MKSSCPQDDYLSELLLSPSPFSSATNIEDKRLNLSFQTIPFKHYFLSVNMRHENIRKARLLRALQSVSGQHWQPLPHPRPQLDTVLTEGRTSPHACATHPFSSGTALEESVFLKFFLKCPALLPKENRYLEQNLKRTFESRKLLVQWGGSVSYEIRLSTGLSL